MVRFLLLTLIAIGCGKGGPEYTIGGSDETEPGQGEEFDETDEIPDDAPPVTDTGRPPVVYAR